ncbi:hypothetical protein E2C01_030897 [Portunus trituberculatus]|uniref:Uncharacterized protein n=1 Tax=Portunus trituberculatus TaxID=210409 RepID=A0A5B7EWM5_PORTR|nr:hypothetical protein [Portunus trituberculatus]
MKTLYEENRNATPYLLLIYMGTLKLYFVPLRVVTRPGIFYESKEEEEEEVEVEVGEELDPNPVNGFVSKRLCIRHCPKRCSLRPTTGRRLCNDRIRAANWLPRPACPRFRP